MRKAIQIVLAILCLVALAVLAAGILWAWWPVT